MLRSDRHSDGCSSRHFIKPSQKRTIPLALGTLLETKCVTNTDDKDPSDNVEIENCELIASYNLLQEGFGRTILVPGRPPAWTPLPAHTPIRPDNGTYFRDENAARFPNHPMEPAVRSILHINPKFDPSAIEVFACGSTLGDIVRFSLGKGQAFSFTVHVIGNTAFSVRRTMSPTELVDNVSGFGHSFPEANTTWSPEVVGSCSHQRVIQYTLGSLQFLVRFEGDGYTLDDADDLEEEDLSRRQNDDVADKAASWAIGGSNALSQISTDESSAQAKVQEPVRVRSRGRLVSQSSVFDIKTRSSWKPRDSVMAEQVPRLWVRQIHKLVLALHYKGDFDHAEVLDISGIMGDWERKSASTLRTLTRTVGDIRDAAMTVKGRKIEVRGTDTSNMEFRELSEREQQRWNALPDDLEQRWMEKRQAGLVT